MHSGHAGRAERVALIPAALYHIWPPKPISGFHPGSGGLLSSAPCRTSRRKAKTLRSIRSQRENCFTKQSIKEIAHIFLRIKY